MPFLSIVVENAGEDGVVCCNDMIGLVGSVCMFIVPVVSDGLPASLEFKKNCVVNIFSSVLA